MKLMFIAHWFEMKIKLNLFWKFTMFFSVSWAKKAKWMWSHICLVISDAVNLLEFSTPIIITINLTLLRTDRFNANQSYKWLNTFNSLQISKFAKFVMKASNFLHRTVIERVHTHHDNSTTANERVHNENHVKCDTQWSHERAYGKFNLS